MQLRLPFLITVFFFLLGQISHAQPICAFDSIHKKLMREDPIYRAKILEAQSGIRRYVASRKGLSNMRVDETNAGPYIIPVVVHVVHTGGAIGTIYNPTDAQIIGAINYLNQVYSGTYPGTQGVGDMQLQFALAQRDPNCNPTNGIDRINGSSLANYVSYGVNSGGSGSGATSAQLKNYDRWNPSNYYNIWVVNKIDGKDGTGSGSFVAGFAALAGGSAAADGTVMLATQMKTAQKTLPHEIGHAMSLLHPFEGSADASQCPSNSSCSVDGDMVCDTDPISQNVTGGIYDFSCRTGTNTCTGTAYSINTESNYMNYTNCFTLFTAGQKSNVLAAMTLPSRTSLANSLGATPTTDVSNPCPPKIDFEFSEGQVTEAIATTTGCRSYQDYTYNMVIGNDPSLAATALLNIASATATEGVDFDITTNGSFSSPSKTLNFPAGSHAAQPFTIRIYDDASVESAETFTLGFTVNSGGGTAVKGDGRINLVFTINDNDVAPSGPATTIKSIGGYTTNLTSPFTGTSGSQKAELLYKAAELNAAGAVGAGNITGLAFNVVKNTAAGFVYQGFTIKMALTSISGFAPQNDAGYTTVYSGNYSTVNGLNSFTFSTPFAWDGTSNIIVVICYDNGATTSASNDYCQAYSDGGAGYTHILQNGINCGASYTGVSAYPVGTKPNIQFTYTDSGTGIQTVLNSSKTEYLGPNADVYFYDQTSSKLMARISNSTSFDYGCTQVTIDRSITSAGTNSVAFWNNTPANYLMSNTLKVAPTTNNPSGSYQISLYYTQAEVNAWQTATGQTISNAQVVKVGTQISDVTPANPGNGGTVVVATPTVSTLGTNTVLTASFSNGFSGFGAGIAGNSLLPVLLLDFKGSLQPNAVLLEWNTSSEINSRYFDIERSADGVAFNKIGTVNAAGNSSVVRYYSFTDPAALQFNYYRLKQVDLDGKFEYSKVILIENKNYTGNVRIINNPFTDVLDIDFGKIQSGKTDVRLLDVTGKEIYHVVNDVSGQSRLRVNVSGQNISAGVYLLQVNTNRGQFTARVMKQ